ncbi:MAG: alpha-L-fucosidase [Bacteroidota bacterium]
MTSLINPVHSQSQEYLARMERTEWFREARFGMFIHWGIYAIPARGEWVRSSEEMSIEAYDEYFKEFDPYLYDPAEWAKLAKEAGMKYAVLTAKHHDGFCLWDTKTTEYNATNTPAKRDLLKEFVEAFRNEGIKVGFYYSLVDWYHPDYPAYGDRQHPMRNALEFKDKKHNFDNYLDYMHAQVEELVSNYGKIDIMWFDFSYHQYRGEKWRGSELVNMVRAKQPHIIIDNRLGGDMEKTTPDVYAGDFDGPEQGIPRSPIVNEEGFPLPWEACMTLNDNWGYSLNRNYKTPQDVIRYLVNATSKGGNLLVNVGPNAYGEIPEESAEILKNVGKWMKKNGKAIYGAGVAEFEKPEWGRFTKKDNKLYAFLTQPNFGHISMKGFKDKIKKARLLKDGAEVLVTPFWNAETSDFDEEDDIFLNFAKPVARTYKLPDPLCTVIEIELK